MRFAFKKGVPSLLLGLTFLSKTKSFSAVLRLLISSSYLWGRGDEHLFSASTLQPTPPRPPWAYGDPSSPQPPRGLFPGASTSDVQRDQQQELPDDAVSGRL